MSIRVTSLTKRYGEQAAIQNLSFEVGQGQVLGFLGPNGAGKTTTMKILTGYITPTEGEAEVNGISVREAPLEARRQLGYLPEHNPLYLDMYVVEFLDFTARIFGIGRQQRPAAIRRVIEMTGLGLERRKKIRMLSKGYRQRVGLAQALIHDPAALILDEPTTGLDPNQIVEIRSLIREAGKNKTVIFSSHILTEVEAIADRIAIIHRGRLVADADTEELQRLEAASTVIVLEVSCPGLNTSDLSSIEGAAEVRALSKTAFEIRPAPGADIRPALFALCVRSKTPIIGLRQQSDTLETIFRKLTT